MGAFRKYRGMAAIAGVIAALFVVIRAVGVVRTLEAAILAIGVVVAFTIYRSRRRGGRGAGATPAKFAGRQPARREAGHPAWRGRGEKVEIGPYVLVDPLTYVDRSRKDEASCIDPSLPIGAPRGGAGAKLGEDPRYADLTPSRRGYYLRWLAGGRVGPLDDIGYAFLFFYGLERRLLVEGKDFGPIVEEVVRLLETYPSSGSFDGYLGRFLAYVLARSGVGAIEDRTFGDVFERAPFRKDEAPLAVGLAWLFERKKSLPASWALRIARLDARSPRSVVLDRLPAEFEALFVKRYRERFGEGMTLQAAKREKTIEYRPASPSILDMGRNADVWRPVKVANVLGLPGQFAPLVEIWSAAIEELKPLSRVRAKGAEATTREAFEALPESLKADAEHPDKDAWEALAARQTREDGFALVEVGRLAEIHGIAPRPKLTAKQGESIAETAHRVGFVIEPDPRINGRAYGWKDLVALVRPEEKPSLPADGRYAGAALMMEMGVVVAAADGGVDDEELGHIAHSLESQFRLDPPDARRLEALEKVVMAQVPSLARLGRRAQVTLSREQREKVGQYLVGVAASNGEIHKQEMAALRDAYKALGLDLATLDQLLLDLRRRQGEPVEVRPTVPAKPGEAIPPRPEPVADGVLRLDPERVRRLLRETEEVGKILGEAMIVVEPEEAAAPEPTPASPPTLPPPPAPARSDARFDGLDARYHPALAALLAKPSWPRAEFEAVARAHALMPSGMLDAINDWAFEAFDDPILDDAGDVLAVHAELIPRSP